MTGSLEDLILKTVKERLGNAIVESLSIEADEDSDGDPILRITVVFASEVKELESHRLAGLVRHVRPKLAECKESRFPIFRFVDKRENDRLRHEAA